MTDPDRMHLTRFTSTLTLLLCSAFASSPLATRAHSEGLPEDVLDALPPTSTASAPAPTLRLFAPGEKPPIIVIGSAPSEAERFAANELATHLEKITGQAVAVVDDSAVPPEGKTKTIAIGRNNLTRSHDLSTLGVEQYVIDIRADGIAIVGGFQPPPPLAGPEPCPQERGTLYGVYELLETVGVRWYRPEPWGWHIPQLQTLEFPIGKTVSKAPAFIGRCGIGMIPRWDGAQPGDQELTETWAARQRLNVRTSHQAKYGGWVEIGLNHAHSRIIAPGRYLKAHPEYFALVNGERGNPGSGKLPQLCLGNPELQDAFAREVIQLAKANPQRRSISVDPEDGTHPDRRMCSCDLCKALDDPEETPLRMSNRVFKFTNAIARKVSDELPGTKVGLYAYSLHTEPPSQVARLEPNIILGLTNINSWTDWTKKMADPASPQNAQFLTLIQQWKKVAVHQLWMREYSAYGWLGPIPMTRLLQDRVQTYRELGFEGFEWPGEANWGPQLPLLYFKARLQWNPDLDLAKELDLFYRNYYGPAAAPMKAYHERWMDAFEQSQIGSELKSGVSSGGRGMHALCTPALLDELERFLREAQAKVKGEPLYERRLQGTMAGYEFCRRISDILVLKLKEGKQRRSTTFSTSYLESEEAIRAWDTFCQWLLDTNRNEVTFEVRTRDGNPFATALTYMKRDILENARFNESDERTLLETAGFKP